MTKKTKKPQDIRYYEQSFGSASTTSMRRDAASTIERTDKYINIDMGMVPFRNSSVIYGTNISPVDVRDTVILCQKCYYNFSLFRNIIDLMTEFSVNDIYLQGGSKKSQDFFYALFNKINLWDLQDKFFREYYRSGNVFVYRFDADIKKEDVDKIIQTFGSEMTPYKNPYKNPYSKKGESPDQQYLNPNYKIQPDKVQEFNMKVPARYIILNPADIQMMSTLNFAWGMYFKILTDYEVARLRTPKTDEDVEVFKNLPKVAQDAIKGGTRVVAVPLDPNRVSMIFYKKQDYEPFAVPMGFPVLEDINAKAEMRKIDMAIARTMQQIILLVTAGAEPDKGGINQKNLDALNKLFQNQSVGRVLIADYTTEAKFIVPDIGELLNPDKYEVINNDINIGLNNVFAGGEKFANQQQRVELFIARLAMARKAFLTNFLQPEIKRIAEAIGLKNYPMAYLKDIELKDTTNFARIYGRLVEVGVLTPEQGLEAIKTGTLPDPETMRDKQEEYKKDRDDGLYVPLIGGPKNGAGGAGTGNGVGNPGGPPAAPKKVTPIGSGITASVFNEANYSLTKIKENMAIAQELESEVTKTLKARFPNKRLTKQLKAAIESTTNLVIANEEPEKWLESVANYCDKPEDKNHKRVISVNQIAEKHQVDDYLAGILYASQIPHATI